MAKKKTRKWEIIKRYPPSIAHPSGKPCSLKWEDWIVSLYFVDGLSMWCGFYKDGKLPEFCTDEADEVNERVDMALERLKTPLGAAQ